MREHIHMYKLIPSVLEINHCEFSFDLTKKVTGYDLQDYWKSVWVHSYYFSHDLSIILSLHQFSVC